MSPDYYMTCDVEEFSIQHSTIKDSVIPKVHNEGLPRILDVFERHNIPATFFFTGYFAERSPASLELVKSKGHEIGCHSYSHDSNLYLNKLSAKKQLQEIIKAKHIIEKVVGPISSFRAPALRTNKYTFEILMMCGFTHDSSRCPRRFDAFLTPGTTKEKLKYITSSRKSYKIESKFDDSKSIIEIPISSLVLPYMSNISRISPTFMSIIRKHLFKESVLDESSLTFLTHPNEFVDLTGKPKTTYRSDYLLGYILTDLLRHKLKLLRMGKDGVKLLEEEIILTKKNGFKFRTINSLKL